MFIEKEALHLIKKVLLNKGTIEITANGVSMYPFIQQGNICQFSLCDPSQLSRGDVVLFQNAEKQLVAHRFSHIKACENQTFFYFKGDTNLGFDHPVEENQIVGKLSLIHKNNRVKRADGLTALMWGRAVLGIPAIPGILRKHINSRLS